MRNVAVGLSRGVLSRVTTLRMERLSASAQRLLHELERPTPKLGGGLADSPERFSADESLRERYLLEYAALRRRRDDAEALTEARATLENILERVGPDIQEPYLDGERRRALLSDVAVGLSGARDEERAVWLGQRLLEQAAADGEESRVTVQLNNLCARQLKLGYVAAFAGDHPRASTWLSLAREAGEAALKRREESNQVGRLLSQHNLCRVALEEACLVSDRATRARRLAEVYAATQAVVREGGALPQVRPTQRLLRGASVGMIMLEQARIASKAADVHALAWGARAALIPHLDLYESDADKIPAYEIRYADACWLCGSEGRARSVWGRALQHAKTARLNQAFVDVLEARVANGISARSAR